MKKILLLILCITPFCFAQLNFGQQFTAEISQTQDGDASHYIWHFDFPNQRTRYDYPNAVNVSVSIYNFVTSLEYTFTLVDDEPVGCSVSKFSASLQKFAFPAGLVYQGTAQVDGQECNYYTTSDSKSQYYTTVSNPVKPVRTFTPAFKFVPQTQVDYLEFNYGADPKAFFIPQDCQ